MAGGNNISSKVFKKLFSCHQEIIVESLTTLSLTVA